MKRSRYLHDVDFLRSIAVIAVIGYHFELGLIESGYLGVDLFFVISGFLIAKIYLEKYFFNLSDISQFFKSRFLRIYPALIFCILISTLFLSFLKRYSSDEFKESLSALYGISNFYYFFSEMDYFALPTNSLFFKHTWTLGVEITFYILFPFIIIVYQLLNQKLKKLNLNVIVIFLSFLSLAYFILYINWNEMAVFYLLPGRFWQFGLGILAFTLKSKFSQSINSSFIVVSIILFVINSQIINLFGSNQIILSALTFIFLNKVKSNTLKLNFLKNKLLLYPGKISYSLYLWHWPILLFSKFNMGYYAFPRYIQFILLILISLFSYYFVEIPSRTKYIKSIFKINYIPLILLFSTSILYLSSKSFLPSLYKLDHSDIYIPPSFELLKDGSSYSDNCVLPNLNIPISLARAEKCSSATSINNSPRIFAFGDSHVGHLQGLLLKINQNFDIPYTLIESPGNEFPNYKTSSSNFDSFLNRNFGPNDILFISRYYLDRKTQHIHSDINLWFETVDKFIKSNNLDKNKILIFGPPPNFFFDNIDVCSVQLRNCDVLRSNYKNDLSRFKFASNFLNKYKNVYIINSFNILCPKTNEYCSPIANNSYLYRDRDHLNILGSSLLFEEVAKTLSKPIFVTTSYKKVFFS